MSVLLNPYRYGGAPAPLSPTHYGSTGQGVLANRTVTTAIGASNPQSFGMTAETYDDNSWHDTVTNPSRCTVPSGPTLVRVVGAASFGAASENPIGIFKNGASFAGRPKNNVSPGSAANSQYNAKSGPIVVAAADYFELMRESANNPALEQTFGTQWLGVEQLDPSLFYCKVRLASNWAFNAGGTDPFDRIPFDTVDVDAGGWVHGGVVTVPNGVSAIRVTSSVKNNGGTSGRFVIEHYKNGAPVRGSGRGGYDGTNQKFGNITSAVIAVSAGDQIDTYVFATNADTVAAGDETWMTVECADVGVDRVLLSKTSGQVVTTSNWGTLTWDNEVYDTAGAHDNVTNNTRITVPSGKTRARFGFNLQTSSALRTVGHLFKNGSGGSGGASLAGSPCTHAAIATQGSCLNGFGHWMNVTPGDYFELEAFASSANHTFTTDVETWFSGEFI